jgi:dihydroorotase
VPPAARSARASGGAARRRRASKRSPRAAILAEWTGARIHILHISSAAELRPLAEAKRAASTSPARPARIICCCPSTTTKRLGGVIRVNPPVREASNQAPLWAR